LPGRRDLLKPTKTEPNNFEYARALQSRLADGSRIVESAGTAVLIDTREERSNTNDSAASTARLLHPLMSTTQMLEADYCGMLIYLWGKAQELHRPNEQEVHIDKIANATIHLPVSFLVKLVDKQLAFSRNTQSLASRVLTLTN
jgi:hypothetical protein